MVCRRQARSQARGSGVRYTQEGPVQPANLNIEPYGLNIGWTCGEVSEDNGGGLWRAGESSVDGLGAQEPGMHERGQFSWRI